MTALIHQSLISALFKLDERFHADQAAFHFAVALVYSSIFRHWNCSCIVVGGQSAAYWLRLPGSIDVDFVSAESNKVIRHLEEAGFRKSGECSFRYTHEATNVQIELVGEKLQVSGLDHPETIMVDRDEIEDPVVRSLMPGPAEVLDPVSVFMNYLDSSSDESLWFDFENEGALSIERAQALLVLYNEYIRNRLQELQKNGKISEKKRQVLAEKFDVLFE